MTKLADASGDLSALWGWKGWLLTLALLALGFLASRRIDTTPTRCNAPLCTEPATTRPSIGDEFVPLCTTHGVAVLTAEMKR